ncbi:MAG: discoidin domain-containing protein [Paludibacteraceae bacterium]|nr:discoidin domain-containing protein [Paludibacteraceae bacterium]
MKKLFFLAALLCASVMAFATAEDTWLEGNANYANQFKWFAIDGVTAPQEVVNIQSKDANDVIYVNVGQADFDRTTGIIGCEAITDVGAGVWIKISSLTKKNNEIYFKNAGGTTLRGLMIYNELGKEVWEIYDTNFALASNGASATASSGNAAMAIDGNTGTRWESQTKPEQTSEEPKEAIPENIAWNNDQWWMVDMGQLRIYNTIQIRWEGAYGKTFDLEASKDGENWKTVKQINNQSLADFPYEQTLELAANDTARYIRFTGIARGTGYGYSFWEFRVLLPNVSVLTSIGLTAADAIAPVGGAGVALTVSPKDQNNIAMEAEISYEITPADAGNVVNGKYIPAKMGNASIVAYNGEVRSAAVEIYGYTGTDVALNKEVEASGYDETNKLFPSFAVDDNEGSLWSARAGETGNLREYDAWITVDLGAKYDINLVAIRWEGACSKHYHVDFSEDKTAWRTAYNAGWNATATHWEYLYNTAEDNTKVRYVRVWSTEAQSQYGIKIMALRVYGTEYVPSGDTEAPVMTSATLVSNTWNSAVISVAATDNDEVAKYHVVNADPAIDVKLVATDGKITVTGLTAETAYNFTITAIDAAQNESENSKSVAVTTNARVIVPATAAPAPTWPAAQVKSIYSDAYDFAPASLVTYNAGWWDNPNMTEETVEGNHYLHYDLYRNGMIGAQFAETSMMNMEKIHIDIFASAAGTVTFRPIIVDDGALNDNRKTLTLEAEQWNSFDIDMTEFGDHNWAKVFQFSIENYNAGGLVGEHISVDNLYFYRTTELEDDEDPTNVSASKVSESYFSAILAVSAEDNSGAVNYVVKNGEVEVATSAGVSGETVNITVTGLTPNTDYTFNVIAKDEAGNEADPVAVAVKTLVTPVAAPVPTFVGMETVVPVFTDAQAGGPAINFGSWGQSTVGRFVELAANDHVCYGSNFNYMGWELASSVDATGMTHLHVDFYTTNLTKISVTPISPGKEGVKVVNLTADEWNSVDIELSDYDGKGIVWENIFQFKFFDAAPTGGELFIDNVYFYKPSATAIDNTVEAVKVQKMIENGQLIIIKNGIRYNVAGQMVQ